MNMVNVNLSEDYDEGDKHGTWTWDKEKKFWVPDGSRTHGLQDTDWAI